MNRPSHGSLNHPSGPVQNCFPAGLCLVQLNLSPNLLALSRLPAPLRGAGQEDSAGFPYSLSQPASLPALPPELGARTHAAMPETPRSFDRLCPGGRPFLCREESLSSARGERTLLSICPLFGKPLFLPRAQMLAGTRASSSEPPQKPLACIRTVGTARREAQALPNIKSLGENSPTFLGTGLPRRFSSSSNCRARWKRNGNSRDCAWGLWCSVGSPSLPA